MAHSVAELCTVQQISLAELHERCGLEASRVMAIVEGRWTPSPRERERIASAFGVAVDDISWGHKTPIQHLWGHGPT
jgi:transcriptional regulator with XRE-family HTH domain